MEKIKIDTKNLNLHYGENHALKNISMSIRENAVTAFIGPSGCGKSTFLRCINRMNDLIDNVRIDGTIALDGENIYDVLARTKDFWEEKTTDPSLKDKTVLIASHGCAVRALLQNVYHDPENFWHGCVPPNCCINLVEIKNGRTVLLEEDKVYA